MIESRKSSSHYNQSAPVDDVLSRITALVRDRKLLQQNNATESELETTSAEIARLQWRLAWIVQGGQRRQPAAFARPHDRATAAR